MEIALEDVLRNLKPIIKENKGNYPRLFTYIIGDPTQITQLIQNLINNAIKFMGILTT